MTQIQQFSLFGNQGGGLVWQAVQTTSFTATANYAYPVNTTAGAITVTLPASPTAGQAVQITDYAGTFATYNCIINPNGNKINSSTINATLAVNRESVSIVYIDSIQGWIVYSSYLVTSLPQGITYLLVGGGGSGAQGGGGAGGIISGVYSATTGQTYSFVVGAGGTATGSGGTGANGSNTTAFGLTAIGGGGGGGGGNNGASGGSGGGGGAQSGFVTTGGSGTSGQGYAGGTGSSASPYAQGGGGGAGAVGTAASGNQSGNGGVGLAYSITGSSVYYAGGGGGGIYVSPGVSGAGGNGGGGAGAVSTTTGGTAGTVNTGGGGGGAGGGSYSGGAGGSGVVILAIPTAQYTGTTTGSPTVTTSGIFTILKFTVSGSYTA
jgi:hypothetical protein